MKNEFLRHLLYTIKYRLNKSLIHYNEEFDHFSLGKGSRSPLEILVHIDDVLTWTIIRTQQTNQTQANRVYSNCRQIQKYLLEKIDFYDDILDQEELDFQFAKKLLQGPLADILTHIGQIAMLSRINHNPIKGEDFSKAKIE